MALNQILKHYVQFVTLKLTDPSLTLLKPTIDPLMPLMILSLYIAIFPLLCYNLFDGKDFPYPTERRLSPSIMLLMLKTLKLRIIIPIKNYLLKRGPKTESKYVSLGTS